MASSGAYRQNGRTSAAKRRTRTRQIDHTSTIADIDQRLVRKCDIAEKGTHQTRVGEGSAQEAGGGVDCQGERVGR